MAPQIVQIAPPPAPQPGPQDSFWALCRAAVYLTGRGVTFGSPLIPQAAINPAVYSLVIGLVKGQGVMAMDKTLDILADGSLDHVLVTPQIEALDSPESFLREATRKLKTGGHLVLLVNVGNTSPGAVAFYPASLKNLVSVVGKFRIKAEYEQGGRYLLILKKLDGKKGLELQRPKAEKRACIARYGALGDAIIMTPLIRRLAEEGYEVTLNISGYCSPIFENNPYISNVLLQERDMIPNQRLGEYWGLWASEYDKYINLSESIEGDLLMVEGRPSFFTSKAWKQERFGSINYTEHTLKRGGFETRSPEDTQAELFFTRAEERRAEKFFFPLKDKFVAVWALNGSSHHKVYPMLEAVVKEWFSRHPDTRVITTGDYQAKLLEFPHPQLIPKAGAWSVRESLISTKYADLVVGPETMMTNASGCFPTPKITLLSHSSHSNLCKHWENDFCLTPSLDVAPCYPCHSLHYSKESCPIGEMRDTESGEVLATAPICTLGVSPERLLARMEEVYQNWKSCRN